MRRAAALVAALWLAACAATAPAPPAQPEAPERATGNAPKPGWTFARHAVAAAHPLAADAGAQALRAGGSAIDAAIAAQLVLGLVEPQSSGIGGGAFLVHWDGQRMDAYDGRETAPAAADAALFKGADGKPLPYAQVVSGGRAVGVPGVLRMLELAHREHGRLPWSSLFEPAIALAEQGFEVSARLASLLDSDPQLRNDPLARALYYAPDGRALAPGTLLRNPDYAAVLRSIARGGADALHRGALADRIVQAVRNHPRNPGQLSAGDLAGYQPLRREPLCFGWNQVRLCGIGAPSSGTITVAQILTLNALAGPPDRAALTEDGLPSVPFLHTYSEAARLAFADRDVYVADPAFAAAPGGRWDSLLDARYLLQRSRLIGERSMGRAGAGAPGGAAPLGMDRSAEVPATSHLAVVDAQGRAASMSSTVESAFGSRLMVNSGQGLAGGFLLNNQLTDFSFVAIDDAGKPVANRVQPGKRPRSSMAPIVGYDVPSKRVLLVTGSAGGQSIIHYTAKSILATLQWGLPAQQAAELPNFGSLNGPTLLEAGRFPPATVEALRARGHEVRELPLTSGTQLLLRTPRGWSAGADPRRDGWAAGD